MQTNLEDDGVLALSQVKGNFHALEEQCAHDIHSG